MSVDIIDVPQRSEAWFAARLGRATGSKAACVLAKGRGKDEAVTRRDYRISLALERLTGRRDDDGFVSKEMQRGTDLEPAAFAAYEALTGQMAMPVGFYALRDVLAGCSPDGVIDDGRGLLSLKCPKSFTHLGYLRAGAFPADYVPQMLHELWITGAAFYDFVSFDDRMPDDLQVFHVRVTRDDDAVHAYRDACLKFLAEVDDEVRAIEALRKAAA